MEILPKSRVRIKAFIFDVFMPLLIGGLLYIAFRSHLRMFRWFDQLGLSELVSDIRELTSPIAHYVPDWIIYSLPDALWIYSFTSVHQILWKDSKIAMRVLFLMSILLGCGAEVMQSLGLISGTFDWMDFILCLLAVIFSIIKQNKYDDRYRHLENRNKVLISLLIYQGLTSDELIRLDTDDIDLDNGTVYVKSSSKLNRRTLKLDSTQILLFDRYINQTRGEIMKRISTKTDKLILNKLGQPISVEGIFAVIEVLNPLFPDRKLNPRSIRMSVISNWMNEKKLPLENVQELAGHKWPSTTEKYRKMDNMKQRELINRFFPLYN